MEQMTESVPEGKLVWTIADEKLENLSHRNGIVEPNRVTITGMESWLYTAIPAVLIFSGLALLAIFFSQFYGKKPFDAIAEGLHLKIGAGSGILYFT